MNNSALLYYSYGLGLVTQWLPLNKKLERKFAEVCDVKEWALDSEKQWVLEQRLFGSSCCRY